MKIFEIIDLIQRRVNSFIFRFILIAYSIIIIVSHQDLFPRYIYLLGVIIYFVIYILLLKKQMLRLINDFIFINFVLIGKNPEEAYIFIYILLPVVNSINFSGNKKSPFLYIFTAVTYLFLLCYYHHHIEVAIINKTFLPLCSLLFLFIIEYYTSLRVKIRDFRERLNEIVDSFYTNKVQLRKLHRIYSEIIITINTRIKKDLISGLYCFTVIPDSDNQLAIINGSKFIWRYKIEKSDFFKGFEKNNYQLNVDLIIENNKEPFNIAFKIDVEDIAYYFIFVTNKSVPFYYTLIGFFRTLIPALSKLAKILRSEIYIQELRNEELKKLSIKSQYVTRAINTMHFIRNRLGPINNLLKMLDNLDSVNSEKKEDFQALIYAEKNRARSELDNIVIRANYLLEKSNNPFNFIDSDNVSLKKLFSVLSKNLNSFFPGTTIELTLPEILPTEFVKINLEGFELFLSDWLSNIKKYYAGVIKVLFVMGTDKVIISFLNNYKADTVEIDRIVADLMSNGRNEIIRRTTHGLFQIKTTLEEMNIKYIIERVHLNENLLQLSIELNFIKNEDSNI